MRGVATFERGKNAGRSAALAGALAVVALLVGAPGARAAEAKSFPAAGELIVPSVVVRKAPSASAGRKMTLHEYRRDYRRQIVLAIGSRLIGQVDGARARLTLRNTAGAPAIVATSLIDGAEGNGYRVGLEDGPETDDFVVYAGSAELMRFTFAQADLRDLVNRVNASSAPVNLELLNAAAPLGVLAPASLSGGRDEKAGTLWYRLNLPIRPFGQTGWIPASTAAVRTTAKRIVINRRTKVLQVFKGRRQIFRARVAVGRPDRKTPRGNFYVAAKYVPPRNAMVSTYALELSAPAGLPDFLRGGVVGIHGTPATYTIGRSASNGCVRVVPSVALRLKAIVPLGTPVKVVG